MSKLYLKVSPFPVANDPLPNNQHEGVTFQELVMQEAKENDNVLVANRTVPTLQNKRTNRINSIDLCIFASIILQI